MRIIRNLIGRVSTKALHLISLKIQLSLISCVLQEILVLILKAQSSWSNLFLFLCFKEVKVHSWNSNYDDFTRRNRRTILKKPKKLSLKQISLPCIHVYLSHSADFWKHRVLNKVVDLKEPLSVRQSQTREHRPTPNGSFEKVTHSN